MWIEVDRAVPCSMLIWRRSRICLTSPASRPIHPTEESEILRDVLVRAGLAFPLDMTKAGKNSLTSILSLRERRKKRTLPLCFSWIPAFLIQFLGKEKCRPASAGRHFLVDVQQRLNCALPSFFLWALVSFDSKVFTAYPWMIN